MGKTFQDNQTLVSRLSSGLFLAWLVLFLLDSLIYGSVSVFFNINYLLGLAWLAFAWRLALER